MLFDEPHDLHEKITHLGLEFLHRSLLLEIPENSYIRKGYWELDDFKKALGKGEGFLVWRPDSYPANLRERLQTLTTLQFRITLHAYEKRNGIFLGVHT